MNEISIIYNCQQAEMGGFWYYFFQLCGIWCEKHILDCSEQWDTFSIFSNTLNLVLMDKNVIKQERSVQGTNILFIHDSLDMLNTDVEIIKWAKKVIRDIFRKIGKDSGQCQQLMELYVKTGLRFFVWEYQELLWDKEKNDNIYLYNRIKKAKSKLIILNCDKYCGYANIYLSYIMLHLKKERFLCDEKEVHQLLVECKKIIDIQPDFFSIYMLAGKICQLSKNDETFSLMYYKTAADFFDGSWFVYYIGRALEHENHLDEAYSYYEKAYDLNKKNYRALFKLAWRNECLGIDEKAAYEYNEVLNILRARKCECFTEITEVEYACKSWMRLANVLVKNMNLSTMEELCKGNIEEVENKFAHMHFFVYMSNGVDWETKKLEDNIKRKIQQSIEMQLGKKIL